MDLHDKIAIITGAGTGVGRGLALGFSRAGARVVCCGRRVDRLNETLRLVEAQGGQGLAIPLDVTIPAQVDAMEKTTLAAYGRIDLLFNNAGSFQSVAPIWEVDPETWWRDVTTNLYGSMLCCRAVLPHMMARDEGIIINMDGGGGSNGPNIAGSAYGCSKAALLRFSEGLARELEIAGSKVLVFCMNPGFVHTEMTENIVSTPTGRQWQGFVKDWIDKGIGSQPDDCAKATLKLLPIASPELNGRCFGVDTDFTAVERRKAEIQADNLYVLHLKKSSPGF
jgi:NAD(P)-dependent dehydrogenase (short-subunit alcohol dehydrogenase family)